MGDKARPLILQVQDTKSVALQSLGSQPFGVSFPLPLFDYVIKNKLVKLELHLVQKLKKTKEIFFAA